MSLFRVVATSLLASACLATPATAADPVMPLEEVRAGMRCTGYSVVQGIDPVAFDVEMLEVVDGTPAVGSARLLVRVSGPAVDATGIGQGFSGSPIYCPDAAGVPRVAGAISEAIGEYGGKVVLATPIEAMLAVPATRGTRSPAPAPPRASRPLRTPLVVSGLSPRLATQVSESARRAGRAVLTVPAGPLASFPRRPLRPGSAVAVGLSSGDVRVSGIGTVAYVDGPRVWAFGHGFDSIGPRSLMLQDAYVYRVINNPQTDHDASTYKLAAPGRTIGTLTHDSSAAVAGLTNREAPSIPIEARAADLDRGVTRTTDVRAADETGIGNPAGSSPLSLVAPLAVAQSVAAVLGGADARLHAQMCAEIAVAELSRPLELCNRYVSAGAAPGSFGGDSVVGGRAAEDIAVAIGRIDAFPAGLLGVESVKTRMRIRHGSALARLLDVSAPERVKRGSRFRVEMLVQTERGPRRRAFSLRLPSALGTGQHTLRFVGSDADDAGGGDADFFDLSAATASAVAQASAGSSVSAARASALPNAKAVKARELVKLRRSVASLSRFDGVTLVTRIDGRRQRVPVFRDRALRIAGSKSVEIRVTGARRAPARR